MYVVMGASGNTGGVVAEKLLAKGQKVRVVGRDAKRLDRFAKNGAEVATADATDAAALTKAFSGAEAVYALVPPNMTSDDVLGYGARVSDSIVVAVEKSGVSHAVVLSSYGADKEDKTGPVVTLHNLEQKLGAIAGLNALFLRAGYFMENILPQITVIRTMGNLAGPVRADLPLPMIATRDIGMVATEALLRRTFQGKVTRELQGAADRNYLDAAKVVGAAIGKPGLTYNQMPAMILKGALVQMGMSSNFVGLLLEMADALNSGHMKTLEPRSESNTTPTTLEAFVTDTFLPAYRGQAASA
jgi:uncharacterized protein YbjT (DUF2867 family)